MWKWIVLGVIFSVFMFSCASKEALVRELKPSVKCIDNFYQGKAIGKGNQDRACE